MAASDFRKARLVLAGAFDGLDDPRMPIGYLFRKDYDLSDGGTAATPVAESPLGQLPGTLGGVGATNLSGSFWFTPQVAVTANDTNFATINFYKKTGTGAHVLIATANTKTSASGGTGNLSALVPVRVPASTVPYSLAAGDVITGEITKGGSGVAFSAATGGSLLTVELE